MVILDNAATVPHFITAQLHHPQPVRGDLRATSSARQHIKSFCCAERCCCKRTAKKKKKKKRLNDSLYSSDESVFVSPQGTIFLPGNKVSEHPTSGDDGGKFLFEVIPGRIRSEQSKDFLSLPGKNAMIAALTGAEEGQKHEVLISPVCCKSLREESCHFLSSMITICFPAVYSHSHFVFTQLRGALCSR